MKFFKKKKKKHLKTKHLYISLLSRSYVFIIIIRVRRTTMS